MGDSMSTIINATTTNGVVIQPDNSGSLVLQTNSGTTALTISTAQNATFAGTVAVPTGTLYPLVSGTAVASTSGTSIDFTSIPSWVKRITVMFNGVSTSGSSVVQIQLGDSGGFETTGYSGSADSIITSGSATTMSNGFTLERAGGAGAAQIRNGFAVFCLLGSNAWAMTSMNGLSNTGLLNYAAGTKTLSDTLTQVRITTVNGTDTFDAGSINILYE